MRERQQNSTTHPISFLMVSSSDHTVGVTGITPTVTISKDGASFASPAGAVTELANGWYLLAGNATDRNTLGGFIVHATGTGSDPMDVQYTIVGYDPFDGVRLGLTALPNVASGSDGSVMVRGATQDVALKSLTVSNSAGDAVTFASTGTNGNGLAATGFGTGSGIKGTGGATGRGIHGLGGATSGAGIRAEAAGGTSHGLHAVGFGAGSGFMIDAGATGNGVTLNGGSTSGVGFSIATTSGDGLSITPTAGNALVATANGTSKHGAVFTGSALGTSDGLKAVAGAAGGVDVRGNITGNLAGNVSGTLNGQAPPTNWSAMSIDGSGRTDTGKWLGNAVTVDANNLPNVNARDYGGTVVTGGLPNAGNVTVGAYAANQDPATILYAAALPASPTAGTAGEALKFCDTRLDQAVGSRMATFALPANFAALAIGGSGAVTVGSLGTGSITTSTFANGVLPANFGSFAVTGAGYVTLAPAGLDQIVVETGLHARNALLVSAAGAAGTLSGAATSAITINGANNGPQRIGSTVDAAGNRLAVVLSLPA